MNLYIPRNLDAVIDHEKDAQNLIDGNVETVSRYICTRDM